MSSDLMQFGFEGHDVRVHIEGSDELWFVAFDICRVLSLTNVSKAVSRLLPNECRDITFSDVTGRPIHHREIAIAAIESHIKKVVVTN